MYMYTNTKEIHVYLYSSDIYLFLPIWHVAENNILQISNNLELLVVTPTYIQRPSQILTQYCSMNVGQNNFII